MEYFDTEQELALEQFADYSDKLFDLGVITTDSFTGEIGEFVACKVFKLQKTERVTKAVDGVSQEGERYQVKSKVVSSNYNYLISNLQPQLFDYLVVVYFDAEYSILKILRLKSEDVIGTEVRITASNLPTFEVISPSRFNIPVNIKNSISQFASAFNTLSELEIIRSRRIVGDIGEFYASKRLGLTLSENKTQKGIDAIHPNGLTFEIKTRRVYSSGRRISETRRINNLIGKTADYLIVVTLDRAFRCSGMWLVPMSNIINPKSANLKIVNTTNGVRNLVKSRISWLDTGDKFVDFDSPIPKAPQSPKTRRKPSTTKKSVRKTPALPHEHEVKHEVDKQGHEITQGFLIVLLAIIVVFLIMALI